MIIDELIKIATAKAGKRKVRDVRAGLGYTCVMLEDGSCGLAYSFRNEMGHVCGVLGRAGTMIGMDGAEIMQWARDKNRLKAAIGLAAINAVLNSPEKQWDTGDVTTAFTLDKTDTLGMVGEFKPILAKVSDSAGKIHVFEKDSPGERGVYGEDKIPELLPECDVVILTATSIINHTIDDIMPHIKKAREVCITGPSTPLCPEVFKKYKVTMLAGCVVTDSGKILEIVSQGGGTRSMKPAIRQVLQRI
ncbi:MAG: DUF364 domain-containing protein [Clostridiales bacterium]|nr:DUF364 domain-containing protein [Clostridiales bacterium]